MALIALTVLIARLVILATGWMPIDPLLSAVVALYCSSDQSTLHGCAGCGIAQLAKGN